MTYQPTTYLPTYVPTYQSDHVTKTSFTHSYGLEKLIRLLSAQKILCFYRTQRFIFLFSIFYWPQSSATCIHRILILPSHTGSSLQVLWSNSICFICNLLIKMPRAQT